MHQWSPCYYIVFKDVDLYTKSTGCEFWVDKIISVNDKHDLRVHVGGSIMLCAVGFSGFRLIGSDWPVAGWSLTVGVIHKISNGYVKSPIFKGTVICGQVHWRLFVSGNTTIRWLNTNKHIPTLNVKYHCRIIAILGSRRWYGLMVVKGGHEYHKPVGWSMGITIVVIVIHKSRSLTGTSNYRFGSEVHSCQVLVTGTCKICFSEIYLTYNFYPLKIDIWVQIYYHLLVSW